MDLDSVFKAYDIRGQYPKEIDKPFAYNLGRAMVVYSKSKEISLAYDGRKSSPILFEALCKGILEQGADVVNLGLCSTPAFYYSQIKGKYAAGIMITASHDPKEYNGFKLMIKGADLHLENGSQDVKKIMEQKTFVKVKKKGKKSKKDFSKEYKAYLKSFFTRNTQIKNTAKEMKVLVDQGNGVGKTEADAIKELFPAAKIMNSTISGAFPAHPPNPMLPESRKKISFEIKKSKADLGLMFDGDADRVCFLDEKGEFLRPDIILNILASEMRGGKIIYDARSSKSIQELSLRRGIDSIMSKSGRSYINETMKKEDADLGGEESGHYFYKEFSYLDNAGITAIKILNILGGAKLQGKKMSDLYRENHLYFNAEELNFKVKNQSKAFLLVEQSFPDAKKLLFIDGLSIYYDDFWFNIRKSNTEPLIRVNIEANSQDKLSIVIDKIKRILSLIR